jgi:type I restriction enzyme R subunit
VASSACKPCRDFIRIYPGKAETGTFVRFYEFMSQIVDYDDKDLEKLSLYARNLRPMLRESFEDDDPIDLSNVEMSHYRLSKQRQQDLVMEGEQGAYGLKGGEAAGTAKPKDKKEEALSLIIERFNELFVTDQLTDKDLINYAYTVRDKVRENEGVMKQIANNSDESAMLGDFTPSALNCNRTK